MTKITQQGKTGTFRSGRLLSGGVVWALLCVFFLGARPILAEVSVGEIRMRGTVYTAEDFAEEEETVVEEGEETEKKRWKPFGFLNRSVAPTGYLISSMPVAVRFSDVDLKDQRTPLPALPEYSILSNRYNPYLIEEPLPEDEQRQNQHLEHLVINMEPHRVVSGAIDFNSGRDDFRSEDIFLEDSKTEALRADEVLIFFETDVMGSKPKANVVVPLSAGGNAARTIRDTTTTRSSATYTIEE